MYVLKKATMFDQHLDDLSRQLAKRDWYRSVHPRTLNTSFMEDSEAKIMAKSSLFSPRPSKDKYRLHKSLIASKSSPSLSDTLDDRENNCPSPKLSKSQTADFTNSPPFMNPHKALVDLYNKYSSKNETSFVRSFSHRNRKLKKLDDIYSYCNKENTFTVKIRKSSRGLGLCICGGSDVPNNDLFHQLIRIWNLHPLQPAMECGKLTLGDVILEVNGISMLGLTNNDAVEVLRSAPEDVDLKIFRPSQYLIPSFPVKEKKCSANDSSCCSNKSTIVGADKNGNSTVVCVDKLGSGNSGEIKVTLVKKDGCLGFSIVRKDDTNNGGIFIKALTREPAISDGRIQPGDRILQVNGTNISSFSHSEAVQYLRNAPEIVALKMCRICDGITSCPKHALPKVHTFNVVIVKFRNETFGLCIWDSIDDSTGKNLMPCTAEVKAVYPGSLADKNGINVGDRILEVNGESLIGKTADEAIEILRIANGVVRMVFCRLQCG